MIKLLFLENDNRSKLTEVYLQYTFGIPVFSGETDESSANNVFWRNVSKFCRLTIDSIVSVVTL